MEKPALNAVSPASVKEGAATLVSNVCGRPAQRAIRACASLMRPHQWTKNAVCFAGLFFAGKALNPASAAEAATGCAAFCFASSFVYAINDIFDREKDRLHPVKKLRPIPSGRMGVQEACAVATACLLAAFLFASFLGLSVVSLLVGYVALNLSYTLSLKNIVLVDVMAIACGFIVRILVGTEAVHVSPSAWILLCTFFLALFLGFGKRRAELQHLQDKPCQSRRVLSQYSVAILDRYCNIFATLSIAAYALFTVTARPDHALLITCPPVVFGLLRYLFLIEGRDAGESPDMILLQDKPLQFAILLWAGFTLLALYSGLRLPIL